MREGPAGEPDLLFLRIGYNDREQSDKKRLVPRGEREDLLQTMLAGVADLVPAHTMGEAFKVLKRDQIDLIVCTIASMNHK